MEQNENTGRPVRRNAKTEPRSRSGVEQPICGVLVKLHHYCKLTGDTPQAVHSRRKRKQWIDGQHCHVKEGRRLWIDINEVNKWVRNSETN